MENKQAISEQMVVICKAFASLAELVGGEVTDQRIAPDEAEKPREELPEAPTIEQDGKPSYDELKALTLKASRAGHSKAIREKLSDLGVQRIGQLESEQGLMEFWNWLSEQAV